MAAAPRAENNVASGLTFRRMSARMQTTGAPIPIVAQAEVPAFRAVAAEDGTVFVAFAQHGGDVGWLGLAKIPR